VQKAFVLASLATVDRRVLGSHQVYYMVDRAKAAEVALSWYLL
jgi:hypothetical protein